MTDSQSEKDIRYERSTKPGGRVINEDVAAVWEARVEDDPDIHNKIVLMFNSLSEKDKLDALMALFTFVVTPGAIISTLEKSGSVKEDDAMQHMPAS